MVLPWEQLQLVLAIARHATLAGAARALRMSRAVLEAELKAVERGAGAALFVRENGQLLPTDAGRSALRTGERMSEEMERVGRALPPTPPGPPVRVGMDALLAARWLQGGGGDVVRRLGPVTLELSSRASRRGAALDLEVTARRPARDGRARSLGAMGEALYASEGYLLDHGRPERTDGLVGHRIVLLTGAAARSDAGRWLQAAVRSGADVGLRTDAVASMLSAVAAGAGIGVLPRGSEEIALELVRVANLPEIPMRPLWLIAPSDARLSARVRRTAELLERSLAFALRRWERG